MACEYDVWSNSDGRIKSTVASKDFVDDSDAPYLFTTHEIRVNAESAKDAVKQYRLATKAKYESP
jgi:hypothetical protein